VIINQSRHELFPQRESHLSKLRLTALKKRSKSFTTLKWAEESLPSTKPDLAKNDRPVAVVDDLAAAVAAAADPVAAVVTAAVAAVAMATEAVVTAAATAAAAESDAATKLKKRN
jgi:hypothetical protein